MKAQLFVLIFLNTFVSACIKNTPVTPSPITADQSAELEQALFGTWEMVASQREGSEPSPDQSLLFTFGRGGAANYEVTGVIAGGVRANYRYWLEGRNVFMDGPIAAFRVDEWKSGTLKLFNYSQTVTYICKRRSR